MRIDTAIPASSLIVTPIAAPIGAQASQIREVHKTVDLDPTGRLSIDTHNGSVTITTWDRPSVQVDARIEPGDSWIGNDEVDKAKVRIGGSRSEVSIESDYSDLEGLSFGWLNFFHGGSLPL